MWWQSIVGDGDDKDDDSVGDGGDNIGIDDDDDDIVGYGDDKFDGGDDDNDGA